MERGIDEFVNGCYGEAAGRIRKYIDLLHENVPAWEERKEKKLGDTPWWFRPAVIKEYDALFDQAEAAVKDDKNTLMRVKVARLGVQYEKLRTMSKDDPERAAVMKKFFDVVQRAGISEVAYISYGARHCTPAKFREYLQKQDK